MIRNLALILAFVMAAPLLPAATTQQKVSKWNQGQRMKVELSNGQNIIGRLGPVSAEGFTLNPDKKGGTPREVRFDEVRKVSTKWTTGEKWLLAGLIWGGFTILGAIVGG